MDDFGYLHGDCLQDTEENFREEDEAMPPPTPLNPELKMQSMIEDARGGLDMVKKEASKSKQPTE